jgi:hypothetical protein
MMLLDIGIAILLCLTIVFCYRLNGKMVELHKSKAELSKLFKHFDQVITRAEVGMAEFRRVSKQSAFQLEELGQSSRHLMEDLAQIMERGKSVMHALEDAMREAESKRIEVARQARYASPPPPPMPSVARSEERASVEATSYPGAVPYRPAVTGRTAAARTTAGSGNSSGQESKEESMRKIAIESLLERISAVQTAARKGTQEEV